MTIPVDHIVLFLLIFTRTSAMLALVPVIGHVSVPVQVKAGLGVFLGAVVFPGVAAQGPSVDLAVIPLALLALREAAVGMIIGFAASLLILAVQSAGELSGFELGFSTATLFDPDQGQTRTLLAEAFGLTALLLFVLLNGHHFMVQAIVLSYDAIPLGSVAPGELARTTLVGLTGQVVAIAVKLSAPVIVAGFLVNLAMAVLARVAPQMNVFFLSFPIKIGVGLAVLMTSGALLVSVFRMLLTEFETSLLTLMRGM
jgi:flagellar biosynthetic protein FliR